MPTRRARKASAATRSDAEPDAGAALFVRAKAQLIPVLVAAAASVQRSKDGFARGVESNAAHDMRTPVL